MSAPSPVPQPDDTQLGSLIRQVQQLEQRVIYLEQQLGVQSATATAPVMVASPPVLTTGGEVPSNAIPILGRTLVAIAGAYVLRALTEWGTLPASAGVAIGLLYALVWLWLASRAAPDAKFVAALSTSTSVLILAPLVWEATGRLHVFSSAAAAATLAVFALLALAAGTLTTHHLIATIAVCSSILTLISLILAHDDIVPYAAALLVIAAALEIAAWRDQTVSARLFAALAANATLVTFAGLMSSHQAMPDTWVAASPAALLAAQITLAVIYLATAVVQTIPRHRTLSFFEMGQAAAALLTGIGGAVWVFHSRRPVMLALGLAALAAGLACYAVSFRLFERDHKWNFRAWASFGLLLMLAGIYLPFSSEGFWILAAVCAIACCRAARAFRLPTLTLHGAIYLLLGSASAGATGGALFVLFGLGSGPVAWRASLAVLAAAVLCWQAIFGLPTDGPGSWRPRLASLTISAHAIWITAGMASFAAAAAWPAASANVPSDTLATVIMTALSLALASLGTRWNRRELLWLLYAFLVLGAYKLLARDFPNEHNFALVVSLVCFGGALILLPRILRSPCPATQG